MAGKIHKYDCYDLRKFGPDKIMTFVDIGANVGTTSIMARILFPRARILAFEPAPETFEKLSFFKSWFIECHQLALGDGTKLSYDKSGHSGLSKFYSEQEKKWWKQDQIMIESKTLPQIFQDHKIDIEKPYIIKMDCEGGERFILNDNNAIELVRKSVQSIFEIHIGLGGTTEQWQEWFGRFADTHELRLGQWEDKHGPNRRYIYKPVEKFDFDGKSTVELIRTDFTI